MLTFREFLIEQQLNERFINVFTPEEKEKYADVVWDILQKSYGYIGGIKGAGFANKQDMIDNIPFWKLGKHDGAIKSVTMYKDKNGRKSVAQGTDGSREGKLLLKDVIKNDFGRSYGEKSGKMLDFTTKRFPNEVEKYTISPDRVKRILDIDDIEPAGNNEYYRTIGNEKIRKRMIGTPHKPIVNPK